MPKISPTDCLCLGRARVGNRWVFSPYSPCCFQEHLTQFNPCDWKSLAPLQIFYNFIQTADLQKLSLLIREWPGALCSSVQ
jgi:hypothetical protein